MHKTVPNSNWVWKGWNKKTSKAENNANAQNQKCKNFQKKQNTQTHAVTVQTAIATVIFFLHWWSNHLKKKTIPVCFGFFTNTVITK